MFLGKKRDCFAFAWLPAIAASLAMTDISALQGSARLLQRWPQFSLEGQFLPMVLVQIYGPRTLKSAKLISMLSPCSEHCEASFHTKSLKRETEESDWQRQILQKHASSSLLLLVGISSGKITTETTQCEGRISRHQHMTLLGPIILQVFLIDAVSSHQTVQEGAKKFKLSPV